MISTQEARPATNSRHKTQDHKSSTTDAESTTKNDPKNFGVKRGRGNIGDDSHHVHRILLCTKKQCYSCLESLIGATKSAQVVPNLWNRKFVGKSALYCSMATTIETQTTHNRAAYIEPSNNASNN